MNIEIISPEEKLFEGEAVSVKLPGAKGQFQILNGHAPIISSLEEGNVIVQTSKGEENFKVSGGVVEVLNDKITVLV